MTPDLEELKRLAEAATPGPWFDQDFTGPEINADPRAQDVTVSCTWPDHIGVAQMCGGVYGHMGLDQARKDAAYIAAASPDRILSLIARVEAAEAQVKVLKEALQPFAKIDNISLRDAPNALGLSVVWEPHIMWLQGIITVGQVRAARTVLGDTND